MLFGQRSNIFDVKKRVSGEIETMVSRFNIQNKESNTEIKVFIENMATKNDEVLSQVNNIANKFNDMPSGDDNKYIVELKQEFDKLKNNLTTNQENSKALSYSLNYERPLMRIK
ncbi:hypothetical protein QH639_17755 [Lysinibacillus sp. 1 U-2021]|uniref:hypothetical protein n=1 Tax=Lysinibacillus sp. 1 U-2021 TaxID=3039426 RepID=UPI002480B8BC|nr:hypothetical protein [Lysinibacillus sp. 1 U-2021]WGT37666.1 hypothetical protein QH639_17755 [Lysinibacillus sp. 1 U-2021]